MIRIAGERSKALMELWVHVMSRASKQRGHLYV